MGMRNWPTLRSLSSGPNGSNCTFPSTEAVTGEEQELEAEFLRRRNGSRK
jgi:hypothetical protein